MIIDSFIHFTIFFVFLTFSFYLFLKRSELPQTAIYSLLFFCFSIWSFGFVFLSIETVKQDVLNAAVHISSIASIGYGILVFLSIGKFTGWINLKKWLLVVITIYVAVVSVLQINGYIFNAGDFSEAGYFDIKVKSDYLVLIFSFIHNSFIIASFVILFVFFLKTSSKLKKKQSKIILITGTISYILSLIIVHLSKFYPVLTRYYYPDLMLMIFMLGIAYGVFRLEIFEITPSTLAGKIVKMMPSGLIVTDRDMKIVSFNKQFSRITGVNNDKLIDQSLKDVFSKLAGKTLDEEKDSFTEKIRLISGSVVLWKLDKILRDNIEMGTISTVTDISKEEASENELKKLNQNLEKKVQERTATLEQREKYLTAINEIDGILLGNKSVAYQEFVSLLGKVTHACHTYLYISQPNTNDQFLLFPVAEYLHPNHFEKDNNALRNLSYKILVPEWKKELTSGKIIDKRTCDLPKIQRDFFESHGMRSILLVPFNLNNNFYGCLSFFNCYKKEEWTVAEQDFLLLAVNNLKSRITIEDFHHKLMISEERYRVILEQSNDAIFVIRNESFSYVNSYFIDLFGYSFEELNTKLFSFNADDQELSLYELAKDIKIGSTDKIFNFSARTKNGKVIRCEVKFNKLEKGDDIVIHGIIRDITQREKDADRLKQLSTAVEQSPVSIIITDKNGKIEYVNPKFTNLTGYTRSEVVGEKPNILKSGNRSSEEYAALWRTILAGEEWRGNFKNRKKNGEIYYESAIIAPILDDKNNIAHFIAVKEDITNKKEAEEKILQSQLQLKKLAAHLHSAREEERISISRELHDNLGQSLTALRMYLFRLKKKISLPENRVQLNEVNKLNNDIIEYVDSIITSVKQLARNIRPLILEQFGLVSAIRLQLEEFSENTGVYSTFFTDTESLSLDINHSSGVYRIVQEALTNVARHAEATKVAVTINREEHDYIIKIRDNGQGINQQQLSNTNTLGILGMKERAYIFDGKLKIEGFKNQGTVVEIVIPRKINGYDKNYNSR